MPIKQKTESKKQYKELKATIKNFDKYYNVIKIFQNGFKFYLQRINYPNLYLMGVKQEDLEPSRESIESYIKMAEQENFWEED